MGAALVPHVCCDRCGRTVTGTAGETIDQALDDITSIGWIVDGNLVNCGQCVDANAPIPFAPTWARN